MYRILKIVAHLISHQKVFFNFRFLMLLMTKVSILQPVDESRFFFSTEKQGFLF